MVTKSIEPGTAKKGRIRVVHVPLLLPSDELEFLRCTLDETIHQSNGVTLGQWTSYKVRTVNIRHKDDFLREDR